MKKINYDTFTHIRISQEEKELHKKVADDLGMTTSKLIRKVVYNYCLKYMKIKENEDKLKNQYFTKQEN